MIAECIVRPYISNLLDEHICLSHITLFSIDKLKTADTLNVDNSFKDMDKLKFSFRLYDVDNNGVVDMEEVTAIIETLDSIEGVKPGPKQIPYRRKLAFILFKD